jgi:hypothetical protein
MRVEVGADGRIDSVALEPEQEALARCVRGMAGQRVRASQGTYLSTVQLP